uniref:Uncharacterized protein n=1 Tax=Lepeophtheirus salmonis TaxID=72036 RepID=A0A0K2TM77_LEPSM
MVYATFSSPRRTLITQFKG